MIPSLRNNCPVLPISKHEDLYIAVVKFLNEVSDQVEFLSKQWIRKALIRCHPDKLPGGQSAKPKCAEDYELWSAALAEFTSWLNIRKNGTVAPRPRFSDLDLVSALVDIKLLIDREIIGTRTDLALVSDAVLSLHEHLVGSNQHASAPVDCKDYSYCNHWLYSCGQREKCSVLLHLEMPT